MGRSLIKRGSEFDCLCPSWLAAERSPTKLGVSAGVAKLGGKQEAVLLGNRQGCDHLRAKNHLFSPCNGTLGLPTCCFVFFCLLLCFFFLRREPQVCAPPAPREQSVPLLRGEAAKEAEIGQGTSSSSPAPLHTAGLSRSAAAGGCSPLPAPSCSRPCRSPCALLAQPRSSNPAWASSPNQTREPGL